MSSLRVRKTKKKKKKVKNHGSISDVIPNNSCHYYNIYTMLVVGYLVVKVYKHKIYRDSLSLDMEYKTLN